MSKPPKSTLFLERKSYRQRRLRDAARMLPLLGLILWLIPTMWNQSPETQTNNADAMRYIFGVWILLILLSAAIMRALRPESEKSE